MLLDNVRDEMNFKKVGKINKFGRGYNPELDRKLIRE